jgi:hypothetical protein
MNITTRRQIKSKGATQYLANKLTKDLTPVGKERQTYTYNVTEVLRVVKSLVSNFKTRKSTISILEVIDQWLSSIDANVIQFPANRVTLAEQLHRTRQSVSDLRTDINRTSK